MKKLRLAIHALSVLVLLAAVYQIFLAPPAQGAETATETSTETPQTNPSAQAASVPEPTKTNTDEVVRALETRREALEEREKNVDEREQALAKQQAEIENKLKQLQSFRDSIQKDLEAQKQNSEERIAKMVTVFESMSPKAASGVLETLDDWLAVEVLKRMDTKRMAKVMNVMDKSRSAQLSEMMTGYYNPEKDRKTASVAKTAGQAETEKSPARSTSSAMPDGATDASSQKVNAPQKKSPAAPNSMKGGNQ